ncbi:UDP-2,3-diacylglucosamine diphosphatase [Caenimonas aquaedulcis]|uniref:UDP-2,3-diacylglucosamine diphosphatase n=1 Tax=Caenimonas aquaedulcis TaxID=2793270 RepID=UPI00338DC790
MVGPAALPGFALLEAPAHWRAIDFISDLHLQQSEPQTLAAWRRYMAATPADAVFILGDLFEVWVGDDAAREPGLEADCGAVIREASERLAVYLMHGNRDFLVGEQFMRDCHATLLDDPTALDFAGTRWLLTHGDALCLADVDYLKFREQVRAPQWQKDFLARPLPQRKAIARDLRAQSEAAKASMTDYADVDGPAAATWMRATQSQVLIHGHTHKPADHPLEVWRRIVLSDWDAAATPARLEALRIDTAGARRVALS